MISANHVHVHINCTPIVYFNSKNDTIVRKYYGNRNRILFNFLSKFRLLNTYMMELVLSVFLFHFFFKKKS